MKHFEYEQWVLYCDNKIDDEIRIEMEEHIKECDECFQVYLSIIDERFAVDFDNSIVSDEFTDNVMAAIDEEINYKQNSIIKFEEYSNRKQILKQKKINLLVYYTAAACLTLFMMSKGIFSALPNNFSNAAARISKTNIKIEKVINFDWVETFTGNTSDLFKDIFKK